MNSYMQQNPTPKPEPNYSHSYVFGPGLGDKAPEFSATTTMGVKSLSDYKGKWLIFFSHPGDFTPVCTTEFISFAENYEEFKERDAELLGLSIDSNSSHIAWLLNIFKRTGVEIPFPVIADRDMRIARMYGMIQPNASATAAVRTVFFIDPQGIIRAMLNYPLTNGRNIKEILRLLIALQITDANKVVTPADWRPECPALYPPPDTVAGAKERLNAGKTCMDWYLCFTDDKCRVTYK